jgi:hypothetical protein
MPAATAEIAGFEQLTNVTVECPHVETAVAENIGAFSICPYKNINCKLLEKGEFVFSGFVTIDCEKSADGKCLGINECAKKAMRPEVAEAVRQDNDPNNDRSRQDGHVDPLDREAKMNKKPMQ